MATMFESCKHKKQAPRELLDSLPTAQAGTGWHKCAVCAYEAGVEEGLRRAEAKSKRSDEANSARG